MDIFLRMGPAALMDMPSSVDVSLVSMDIPHELPHPNTPFGIRDLMMPWGPDPVWLVGVLPFEGWGVEALT